jgi:hypothetical protein
MMANENKEENESKPALTFKLALDGFMLGILMGVMGATILNESYLLVVSSCALWGILAGIIWEFTWSIYFGH